MILRYAVQRNEFSMVKNKKFSQGSIFELYMAVDEGTRTMDCMHRRSVDKSVNSYFTANVDNLSYNKFIHNFT